MGAAYNADEILQVAERIEVNGARFYRRVAEGAGDDETRGMLEDLAAMEDEHYATFVALREALPEVDGAARVEDPGELAAGYLKAFADGHVFNISEDPSEKLSGRESIEEVLRIAIGLERDSIAFYLGLKEVVPADLGGGKVDDIIREEMGHVKLLSSKVSELKGS